MKQFFKFMLASFTGTILVIILILGFFAGMVASVISMSEEHETTITPHHVLHITWNTPIMDRGSKNPFEGFDFTTFESKKPVGLNDIIKNLEKAKNDPNIDGIFLDMEDVKAGIATLGEIRDKLLDFKKSGKFIISYANGYTQSAYYLASLSDEIYLNPKGMVMFKGLNAQIMFMKELLDKLDIEIQIIRGPDNKYKSAVEPLMLEKMSDANRKQMQELLDGIWGKMLAGLSESRNISIDDLNKIADNLDVTEAQNAVKYHFVDGLKYRDEVIEILKEKTGVEKDKKLAYIDFGKYTHVKPAVKKKKLSRNQIAVIYALGDIKQGKGAPGTIGSVTLAKAIEKARKNKRVKAIVMRVNSPGGDALASDVIRREVELARKEKPFIVSMGDVAASGGYWISTNADFIFAQPVTITGSIGVFGIIPNFKGLMNNKLGITFDKVMTNKNSDFIDVMEPMNDLQKARLNASIIDIYNQFVKLVASTRNLDEEYVDSIAKGRVWTGEAGLKIGLVDSLGGLQNAIDYAAMKANIGDNYIISEYPKRKEFLQQLIEELNDEAKVRIVRNELGEYKSYFDNINRLKNMKGVQARIPYFFTLN